MGWIKKKVNITIIFGSTKPFLKVLKKVRKLEVADFRIFQPFRKEFLLLTKNKCIYKIQILDEKIKQKFKMLHLFNEWIDDMKWAVFSCIVNKWVWANKRESIFAHPCFMSSAEQSTYDSMAPFHPDDGERRVSYPSATEHGIRSPIHLKALGFSSQTGPDYNKHTNTNSFTFGICKRTWKKSHVSLKWQNILELIIFQ